MAWWETVDWQDPINRSCSLNRGLVGWWIGTPLCFGGTRMVDLLNRNNGTLTSMDPATDWINTQYGMALDFDAVNDTVNCGVAPAALTGPLSVTAICKITTTASGFVVCTRSGIQTPQGYEILLNNASVSGNCVARVRTGATLAITDDITGLNDGTFHVMTARLSGSGVKFYVDSAETAEAAYSGTVGNSANLYIGSRNAADAYAGCQVLAVIIGQHDHNSVRSQWHCGFPDMLNHIDDPLRYAEQVAAGGFKAAWAIRQQQVIGGGLGL